MRYGVPQTERTKHSNRVKQLRLYSDNVAEEIFLTNVHDALEADEADSIVVKLKSGRCVEAVFRYEYGDDCPECSGRRPGYCPVCKRTR